jgi:hypothetical protein
MATNENDRTQTKNKIRGTMTNFDRGTYFKPIYIYIYIYNLINFLKKKNLKTKFCRPFVVFFFN